MFVFLCRLMGEMELETFQTAVLPLRGKLLQISLRLMEDGADAEDIVQEVLLRLWNIRSKLEAYHSVEALAVQVTKNLAIDRIRMRRRPEGEVEQLALDSGAKNPAEQLEERDAAACIRRLIDRLPPLQQTIVRMKDVEGYEIAEIAAITGTAPEAIRVNLSRARKKIREQYILLNKSKI